MKMRLALLAAAGSTAMISGAFAQERTGYYGALGAGVVLESDGFDMEGTSTDPTFNVDADLGPNVAIYGALGQYFPHGFRGEIELATRTQQVESIFGDTVMGLEGPVGTFAGFPKNSDLGDITANTLMLNLFKDVAIARADAFTFSIGAGIGVAELKADFENFESPDQTIGGPQFSNTIEFTDTEYAPAIQGLIGLAYDFTDSMQVDLRYRYLTTADADMTGIVNGARGVIDADYTASEVIAGFRWNWGGTVAAPAPAPVEFKDCWDGSSIPVTATCPPLIEDEDVMMEMDPLVVYFDYDKSNLSEAAQTLITARAEEALEGDVSGVGVTGHTDSSGSSAYNQALSTRRASVVRDALVSNGIASSIITVDALGESKPAKPTADGVREPLNRRTEVTFEF